jgi:uncharacterized protein YjbI with pentapeptide repeats
MPEPLTIDSGNSPLRLQVNGIEFQKASLKLLVNISFQNLNGVVTDLVDLWVSLGFGQGTTPGYLASALIDRSLIRAMGAIIKAHSRELGHLIRTEQSKLVDRLLSQNPIDINGIEIDREFFNRPEDWEYLKKFESWMELLLQHLGVDSEKARSMSVELPGCFATALDDELGDHRDKYELLTKYFADTLCSDAAQRQRGWRRYSEYLKKQLDRKISNETFTIRELYVPLRAFYTQPPEKENSGCPSEIRYAYDLKPAMNEWLENDPTSHLRAIRGGPGSGKSTFTKFWAAEVAAEKKYKVWHLSLTNLSFSGDLENTLINAASKDKYLHSNPLDETKILIIFDGLDELAMSGYVGREAANTFVQQLSKLVATATQNGRQWKVLVSGRDTIIQSQTSEFRDPKQIWSLLPYYLTEKEQEQYTCQSESPDLLKEDQRNQWWNNYGQLTGNKYERLPEKLKISDLDEITTQPILNYLLAISPYFLNNEINNKTTCNEIYQSLFEQVYNREWEPLIRTHESTKRIDNCDEFQLVLQEVGLCAWHSGDIRNITEETIFNHFSKNKSKKTQDVFSKFQEVSRSNINQVNITKLFLAFYFQEGGKDQEEIKTFEFTHKSFGEFLTAKRLVRAIEYLINKYNDSNDGWTEEQALEHWVEIVKGGILDMYILKFIRQEIQIRFQEEGGKRLISTWQETCCNLISYLLKKGLPMEKLGGSFYQMNNYAIQSEITLLAMLHACAICTEKLSTIEWKDEQSFGTWLSRMQGQRRGTEVPLVTTCLSWLNLQGANLNMVNLQEADLNGADLTRAALNSADLSRAKLNGSKLNYAELDGAMLVGAELVKANLYGANLTEAKLDCAFLTGAILDSACLNKAHLKKAILTGAFLTGAKLNGSKLEKADLKGTTLDRAFLTGAFLKEAHLDGASLNEADLTNANFDIAILNNAELRGAILIGSSLKRTQLNGADLDGAFLQKANLSYASLQGTKMNWVTIDCETIALKTQWNDNTKGADVQGIEGFRDMIQYLKENYKSPHTNN